MPEYHSCRLQMVLGLRNPWSDQALADLVSGKRLLRGGIFHSLVKML